MANRNDAMKQLSTIRQELVEAGLAGDRAAMNAAVKRADRVMAGDEYLHDVWCSTIYGLRASFLSA